MLQRAARRARARTNRIQFSKSMVKQTVHACAPTIGVIDGSRTRSNQFHKLTPHRLASTTAKTKAGWAFPPHPAFASV